MATITVGTNSYVTEAELTTYATDRGITFTATDKTVLLIKAMDYIETRNYIGTKTVYNQALQFPRILCGDIYSQYPQNYYTPCAYDSLTVPTEIKTAQCIAALLIDGGSDLQSTLTQTIKREKVSVLETEYADYSTNVEQFRALDDILRNFVSSGVKVTRV